MALKPLGAASLPWVPSKREAPHRWSVIPAGVLAAWLSSRLFVDLILAIGGRQRDLPLGEIFSAWDGHWYLGIAANGFNAEPITSGSTLGQTPFPFFPLLPLAISLLQRLGLSPLIAGLLVNHLALLVGLWLTHALVRRLSGQAAASWTCWFLAFSPGSVSYSLLYPEGLLLVFSSGAFLARSQGRLALAATLAALATLTRPNGLAVSLALGGEALLFSNARRQGLWLLVPSLLALLLWSTYLMSISGDPLIWVHAKQNWSEVTLFNLHTAIGGFPWTQLLAALVALGLLLLGWSRQPWGWRLFGLIWILPSFLLGMVGSPRYAGSCFPVFEALGQRVAAIGNRAGWLLLGASALLLALQTLQVGVLQRWTP